MDWGRAFGDFLGGAVEGYESQERLKYVQERTREARRERELKEGRTKAEKDAYKASGGTTEPNTGDTGGTSRAGFFERAFNWAFGGDKERDIGKEWVPTGEGDPGVPPIVQQQRALLQSGKTTEEAARKVLVDAGQNPALLGGYNPATRGNNPTTATVTGSDTYRVNPAKSGTT